MKSKSLFKKLALLSVMVVSVATAAHGQVFILSEDELNDNNRSGEVGSGLPIIPVQDITTDQFAPLGSSIGLLCGFGLAYALFRKKEEE